MKNLGDKWASGEGIFETIRVEDGKVFALHRHHCRAKEAAEQIGMQIPPEEEVALASYQIINSADFKDIKVGRLRWHFAKDGDFSISYVEFQDPTNAARLMVFEETSTDYSIKRKEYPYRNLELLKIAQDAGYDDGIITTADQQIAESAIATLLLKIDDQWVTPPLSSGILNGVVRALVIEAGLGKVRRVEVSELPRIKSALLLTSLRNAQSVREIAGRELEIDNGKALQIKELMNSFKGL